MWQCYITSSVGGVFLWQIKTLPLFIYYRDTLRIKEIRVPPNLTDLPLLSVEVSKGKERSTLLSCFYREHTGGVLSMDNLESQKDRLQRVLSWWSNLSTGNKDLLFMRDINLDFQNGILKTTL